VIAKVPEGSWGQTGWEPRRVAGAGTFSVCRVELPSGGQELGCHITYPGMVKIDIF